MFVNSYLKILVALFFISHISISQVLDNRKGEAFTDRPFFNEKFIKENNLKSLNGYFIYKKKGESMKPTKFKYVYQFDRQGHLISSFERRSDNGAINEIRNIYNYNEQNDLTFHRKKNGEGYNTIEYIYDTKGRVIQENYMREIDSNNQIIRTLKFNQETIKYNESHLQTNSTRYNNYGLPYLDESWKYNEDGYLIEHLEKIKMTSTIYTDIYEYNEQGYLSAIRKKSNQKEGYLEELLFKYDELGNLIEKQIYKNGIFITDIQILYNSKSKLLASVITRQVSTGFMMIIRFKDYEFYD